MASVSSKPAALMLSVLNMGLYFIIIVIASWAINHSILRSRETSCVLSIPARIFSIYFPMGNMATGFFIIFWLLAGIFGFTTSVTGLYSVLEWTVLQLQAAAASSVASLSLTLLAMGLACKEIDIGWTGSNLRTLEVVTIISGATRLFYTGAIHVGVQERQKSLSMDYKTLLLKSVYLTMDFDFYYFEYLCHSGDCSSTTLSKLNK